jgi:Fe-S-cluster containining protein
MSDAANVEPAPAEPRKALTPEDLDRGLRFSHAVEMQTKQSVRDLAATVYAMMETLVAKGIFPMEEYDKRRETALKREQERSRAHEYLPVLADVPDKYQLKNLPEIDCDARIPLCKARCCTLTFPLSTQDLDERVVRWDYGKPYYIGRKGDGYCVHNDPKTHGCGVYSQRPGICRTYDCRNDRRIWEDFEKRIPAG